MHSNYPKRVAAYVENMRRAALKRERQQKEQSKASLGAMKTAERNAQLHDKPGRKVGKQ